MDIFKQKIEELYKTELFDSGFVDEKTGLVNGQNKKFETYPFIGTHYGKLKKILIVGLDVGKEEKIGAIQNFEDRRGSIEGTYIDKHNPHISGTYFTALYFLQEQLDFVQKWEEFKSKSTFKSLLKNHKSEFPSTNPLSYISLTNYYKFVTPNRKLREGELDRKHLLRINEEELFLKEVLALEPEIVVFQSVRFNGFYTIIKQIKENLNCEIYVAPHPSYRKAGGKIPSNYISQFIKK